MATARTRTGGCLCGAVRYAVAGEPTVAGLCHCATCRRLTGSVLSATANWPLDRFRVTGDYAAFERRQFCPRCGSRLFFLSDTDAEVFLGTLDDAPNGIAPGLEVWTKRREAWLPALPGVALHDEDAPPPG